MKIKIKIIDNLKPEDNAMVQALYSRSLDSIDNHLKQVRKTGSGKFMDQYYVGYGHKSIGDCGSFTIFIEGISDLAVKAFQNHQLYNGQQSSTRYLNFLGDNKHLTDKDIKKYFYCDELTTPTDYRYHIQMYRYIISHLTSTEYKNELLADKKIDKNFKRDEWEKAYTAKVFDVARHVLPTGIKTNFSWHTNLRQASDLLQWITYHPLQEVRDTVVKLKELLQAKYKNSFNFNHSRREINYRTKMMHNHYFNNKHNYHNTDTPKINVDYMMGKTDAYYHGENSFLDIKQDNNSRPYGTEIFPFGVDPLSISVLGSIDYGAFRDLQRHRSIQFILPDVRANREITQNIQFAIITTLNAYDIDVKNTKNRLKLNPTDMPKYTSMYGMPMATQVPVLMKTDLKGMIYLLEIRSKNTVHPTLRRFIDGLYSTLLKNETFNKFCPNVFIDNSKSAFFDNHRGTQDIIKK